MASCLLFSKDVCPSNFSVGLFYRNFFTLPSIAIATKGKSCFRFGRGFKKVIDEYFEQHPDRDPVSVSKSEESVIAPLKDNVYHLLYRNFKVEEVKNTIVGFVKIAGCNVSKIRNLLFEWLKKLFVGWGLEEPAEEDLFVSGCTQD